MLAHGLRRSEEIIRVYLALGCVLRVCGEGGAGAVFKPLGFRLALTATSVAQGLFISPDVDTVCLKGFVDLSVEAPRRDLVA